MPNNIQTIIDRFDLDFGNGYYVGNKLGCVVNYDNSVIKQFLKDSLTSMLDGIKKSLPEEKLLTTNPVNLNEDLKRIRENCIIREVINIINSHR